MNNEVTIWGSTPTDLTDYPTHLELSRNGVAFGVFQTVSGAFFLESGEHVGDELDLAIVRALYRQARETERNGRAAVFAKYLKGVRP